MYLLGECEKMGQYLTEKSLKQKETRIKCWNFLSDQERSRGSVEILSDAALFQSWSLVKLFSPQIFISFLHVWEWILPGLKVCDSMAAHRESTEVSWTLYFCRDECLLVWSSIKPKFCSMQKTSNKGTILNAFQFQTGLSSWLTHLS